MKILRVIDVIILAIISIFAIIIVILDTFNIFDNVEFFKQINYSLLSVLLLGFIGTHLTISYIINIDFQDDAGNEIKKIIPSLKGAKIQIFSSTDDMENYLAKRLRSAKNEICDLTWKNTLSTGYDLPKRKKSRKYYDDSIKMVSKNVEYKEVFIFSDKRRIDKLKARVAENREGYSCKYFPEYSNIPRLQFVLIDQKEIIFASSSYKQLIAIENNELGLLLHSYFEQVWNEAEYIMKGKVIYQDVYQKILDKYDK